MEQAYFGNPNVARQGKKARELAAARDVNTLPDPRTYAMVQGLLGTAPDEMGFSVMHPDYQGIKRVAEPAFAMGLLSGAGGGVLKGAELGAVAAGKKLEPMLAGYVNKAMAQGGKPAQLLQDMAQGTRSNIFIGQKASTWDKAAAEQAQMMANKGATPRSIWSETGTWKGPDGNWRQEIADDKPAISDAVFYGIKEKQEFKGPMSEALPHDALYKAYPDTGDISSGFYAWSKPEGTYQASTDTITAGGPGTTSQKSAALHEIQHAIQQREGWAAGGNPEDVPLILDDLISQKRKDASELFELARRNDPLNPGDIVKPGAFKKGMQAEKDAAMYRGLLERVNSFPGYEVDVYKKLAGEAEARATQARMKLTADERRATFPEDSYDVPIDELIVRQGLLGGK